MSTFRAFQTLLFFVASLVTFVFTFFLSEAFFDYFPLSAQAKATVYQWEVLEIKGEYPIQATYSFEAEGRILKNSFIFNKPWSWNEFSAIQQVQQKAKESWIVWYNPSKPSVSALEKQFPYNLLFRALICYAVDLYLFLLSKT